MKTIKIISGTYGYKPNGSKSIKPVSVGGVINIDDAEANRLVSLGVAAFIENEAAENANSGVATNGSGANDDKAGVNPPENKNGSNGENEDDNAKRGHLDAEQLKTMTNENLKKLAMEMGIDTAKCKKKDDYIAAITAVEVTTDNNDGSGAEDDTDDDGEEPPALGAEAPVV